MERSRPPGHVEIPHPPELPKAPETRPSAPLAPLPSPAVPGAIGAAAFPDRTIAHAKEAGPVISRPKEFQHKSGIGQVFQAQADALGDKINKLTWYQKLPGFSAKPELMRQQALHQEAAQHVQNLQEATLADALIKLPPKNRPASIKQALEMTRAGDALLPEVIAGTRGSRDATKERVAQLQWSLYNKAIQQLEGQAKQKGSATREQLIGGMTVLDDGGKVAKFMQGVERKGTGTGSYTRPSSHFQETRDSKLGMDFKDPNIPLPAGKKTVLFGTKDGGSSTYLKNEYNGYDGLGAKLGHAFDFFKTNVLGQRDVGRREKFIPKDFHEKYNSLGGAALDAKQLKARGISYMLDRLPAEKKQDFANYAITKGYNNPEIRKGEEIVIPGSELGSSALQASRQQVVRELQGIKTAQAIDVKVKGKNSPFENSIQKAFGTGVKPSPDFNSAFAELKKANPQLAREVVDALNRPEPAKLFEVDQNLQRALPELVGLSVKQREALNNLMTTMIERHVQMNTQFRTDTPAMKYSDPASREFGRWREAENVFRNIDADRPEGDPKKATINALQAAAKREGFDGINFVYGAGNNPDLGIARGQSIRDDAEGFHSVLALQQGDRGLIRTDALHLAGANQLQPAEKQGIMQLLGGMEIAGDNREAREKAFDKNFQPVDGATYLTANMKNELKQRLLQFAEDRDRSMQALYKNVTGHDEKIAYAGGG